jgi:hypothetical protein
MEHHHRSKLKQSNKGFKDTNKSSKRSLSRINKGKVQVCSGLPARFTLISLRSWNSDWLLGCPGAGAQCEER